jgi:hypothetical protein
MTSSQSTACYTVPRSRSRYHHCRAFSRHTHGARRGTHFLVVVLSGLF